MSHKLIAINLFGACVVRGLDPHAFEIKGAKHKALIVLLATAPFGRRTRAFIQETLWGVADYETGRQNLRRALADIKQFMGPAFGETIASTTTELTLDLSRVQFLGRPQQGVFLEGIEVRTQGFQRWLDGVRANPAQLDALFGAARRTVSAPVLPIVAVIPFRAATGAAEHSLLGDWLAEEICRSLSRSHLLTVISHLSCRQLAQSSFDLDMVRRTLGAVYCVTGGLRPQGGELIIDADFVDVESGRVLWTRQIACPIANVMTEVITGVQGVVEAVGRAIAEESISHVAGRALQDIEDHRLIVAGVGLMHRATLRDFARSREYLNEAIDRSPETAEIHAWLGKWYVLAVFNNWSTQPAVDIQKAIDCTARALDLNPGNSLCLTIDGFAQNNLLKRMDIAAERYEAALQNNPNEALSWVLKSALHTFRDEGILAVGAAARGRRLSPIDPFGYFYDVQTAGAYFAVGSYQQALDFANRSIAANDRHISSLRIKAAALHYLDRADEARQAVSYLMKRQPEFTLDWYRRSHPAAENDSGKRIIAALKAAGAA